MMSNAGYSDRILSCRDCGQDFTFTAGEQEFYASRGLTNDPGRCPSCRAARRSGGGMSAPRQRQNTGEYYETTCADCGRPTSVPFIPREDRPVYCSDCFQMHRPARSGSRNSYGGGRDYDSRDRGRRDSRGGRDRW